MYERSYNLATEELFDRIINIYTKNVSNGSVSKLTKNDFHVTYQSCTLKLNNSRKSYHLVPSYKSNFKVR